MDADGTNAQQLTTDLSSEFWPAVPPDGRTIVFASDRGGVSGFWRMDIDGGNPQPLTQAFTEIPASISPDGKWVLYTSEQSGQPALWKVPLEGGQSTIFNPHGYHGRISPDGKFVEYVFIDQKTVPRRRRVAIIPWEGGEPLRVFDIAEAHSTRWSPDSRGLTYLEIRDGVANLWLQPLDGAKARQLTHFTSDNIFNYAWSRDGKHLAVVRGTTTSDVVLISNFR
jgi:Tol biopolymer transport system component